MTRVVLTDGSSMMFDAKFLKIENGHLVVKGDENGLLAAFAPGRWSHYYFIALRSRGIS